MHSPAHRQHPGHAVVEKPVPGRFRARIGADVLAESDRVLEVDEDGCPARYYFPRESVRMDALQRSETHTHCPFKGDASYFAIELHDGLLEDAAWSYERPYDEHRALAGRIAFDPDRIADLQQESCD
jgi:uncharacterized protein (DUF427 family)